MIVSDYLLVDPLDQIKIRLSNHLSDQMGLIRDLS
jgi:hypothetical protein